MKSPVVLNTLYRNRLMKDFLWVLSVCVVYFITGRISLGFLIIPENIAAIWPNSGIFLSAILLTRKELRYYLIFSLFFTDLLLETMAGTQFGINILYALVLTFDASLAAWLLNRFIKEPVNFGKLRHTSIFILVSVIFTNSLASLIVAVSQYLMNKGPFWESAKWWFLSDGVGTLLLSPLIISWALYIKTPGFRRFKPAAATEVALLFAGALIVNFASHKTIPWGMNFFLFFNYLTFPFLIWAAIRTGVRGVTALTLLLTISSLYFILEGENDILSNDLRLTLAFNFQIFITNISLSSLFLASVVAERKAVENSLKESETKLKKTQQIAHLGTWELDFNTGQLIWSDEVYRIFGMSPDSKPQTYQSFIERVHPDDRAGVDKAYSDSVTERLDGYEIEHRIIRKDNADIRYVYEKCEHLKDIDGNIIRSLGMVLDITRNKKAESEIKKLNQTLEERVAQRTSQLEEANQELEAFSYSVSHDLRSPLRHINGFSGILAKKYSDQLSDDAKDHLNLIMSSASKMGTLIDDLLSFSRTSRAELKKSSVDMDRIIREAVDQVNASAKGRVINWKISKMPEIFGDHNLLRQVWINLIDNAAKYTRTRSVALIEIGYSEAEKEFIFHIKDNGVGFDMKYAKKLFGVFQRLHSSAEFEGTGIGLANVLRIVGRHEGRVWAEAEPDKGAAFYFSIPKYRN